MMQHKGLAARPDGRMATGTLVLALAASLLFAWGCARSHTDSPDPVVTVTDQAGVQEVLDQQRQLELTPASVGDNPAFKVLDGEAVPDIPTYRMGPGDVLEVVYHIRHDITVKDYRLDIQDRISIAFPYHPQFNVSTLIRADGKISLPLVGEVKVVGMSMSEVTTDLDRRYAAFIKKPSLTVSLEEFNVRIDELKKAITTAPRGQSKIAPIAPDGRVGFPIIGNVDASGLTVAQLEKAINERYAKYVDDLQVTLILLEIHNNKLYVYGEVNTPGVYELQGRLNLAQALGQAGGFKDSANLRDVLVFRNNGLLKPMAYRVDLQRLLDTGKMYDDLYVQPADIVYVPKGTLDNVNDLIAKIFTKGLYAVVPFTSSFNVNYDITPSLRVNTN
ncbi:MAG: polysaccharide biosynthesis/export family protein [Desulfovibrionaceae bacterium]|nr:polysaccharide biosynthesis/export family protein [Desulfovibrionaceae bacterium]